jgi:hypothetical protein
LIYRKNVQQGLRQLAQINGEVWFKLDRASEAKMELVNATHISIRKVRENLQSAISLCSTWLQTCWFALDGAAPDEQDENEYLAFLTGLLKENIKPQGVLLYTLARPPLQLEAARLSGLSLHQMEDFANRIRLLGVIVKVSL